MRSATSETIKLGRFELCAACVEYSTAPVEYSANVQRRIFHAPNTMHKLCLFTLSRQTVLYFVHCCNPNAMRRKSSVARHFIVACSFFFFFFLGGGGGAYD